MGPGITQGPIAEADSSVLWLGQGQDWLGQGGDWVRVRVKLIRDRDTFFHGQAFTSNRNPWAQF